MKALCKRKYSNFKKSPIAAAIHIPSPFNARGVLEKPDFVMARPKGVVGEITMTVRAHHSMPTHALKHAGNAVAVPVARELGRQLGAILGNRS